MTEPKHNYIPGKAYKMRNGEKTFFIGENIFAPYGTGKLLFTSKQWGLRTYYYDGNYHETERVHFDIIGEWQEPKKVKGWVNVYPPYNTCSAVFNSKDEADRHAGVSRVSCIPIEFTEGEGL